uniref:Si:dkey-148d16.5 n=1 Tax=Cyprinus carpio carpio TaxID=630221 RepID=A0A9J8BDB2_CYPCA
VLGLLDDASRAGLNLQLCHIFAAQTKVVQWLQHWSDMFDPFLNCRVVQQTHLFSYLLHLALHGIKSPVR